MAKRQSILLTNKDEGLRGFCQGVSQQIYGSRRTNRLDLGDRMMFMFDYIRGRQATALAAIPSMPCGGVISPCESNWASAHRRLWDEITLS